MKFSNPCAWWPAALAAVAAAAPRCPGSPARVHAKCSMGVVFPDASCDAVMDEMKARIDGDYGWEDPHNGGVYTLEAETPDSLSVSRLTGDRKYTDKILLSFSPSVGSDGCSLEACSESQVTSILDFSTNYCNIRNLYCSSGEGCPSAGRGDLEYYEEYDSCGQRDQSKCVVVSAGEAAAA